MEKKIELMPLAEIGHGFARVTENSVEIEVDGINGGMKAWLIGGEAQPIGNIVGGKLSRRISTRGHIGVLITQGGRQMLIGKFSDSRNDRENIREEETAGDEKAPFDVSGFVWRKMTGNSYSEINKSLRFLLSNKSVYENYKKHRHFWVGESSLGGALALKYEEEEKDPLSFVGKKLMKNGYVIVCVDKETNKLYLPE